MSALVLRLVGSPFSLRSSGLIAGSAFGEAFAASGLFSSRRNTLTSCTCRCCMYCTPSAASTGCTFCLLFVRFWRSAAAWLRTIRRNGARFGFACVLALLRLDACGGGRYSSAASFFTGRCAASVIALCAAAPRSRCIKGGRSARFTLITLLTAAGSRFHGFLYIAAKCSTPEQRLATLLRSASPAWTTAALLVCRRRPVERHARCAYH